MITTPLNILVDQYAAEFPDIPTMKGRRNYSCYAAEYQSATADKGRCVVEGTQCHCPIKNDLLKAQSYYIVVTNMDWLLSQTQIQHRKILVIDEAQNLDSTVTRHHTISFKPSDFAPSNEPEMNTWEHIHEWITSIGHPFAKDKTTNLSKQIEKEIDTYTKQDIYEEFVKWKNLYNKFHHLIEDYKEFKEPYCVTINDDNTSVTLRPITATRFLKKIFQKADYAVIMSATPPSSGTMDLSSSNSKHIKVKHTFPKENRPIVLNYAGSMSFKNRHTTLPHLAILIPSISQEKTIIHMHSYSLATELSNMLKVPHFLQDPKARTSALKRWSKTSDGILLSVAMSEGIDLPDDACRTNILAKIPFPSITDPYTIAKRKLMGEEWFNQQVVNMIVQAYGRAVRHKDDKAHFIVTDKDFEWFYEKNHMLFPKWFHEAVGLPAVIF